MKGYWRMIERLEKNPPKKSPRREKTLADLLGLGDSEEARRITLRDILLEAVEEVRRREREKVDRERDEG